MQLQNLNSNQALYFFFWSDTQLIDLHPRVIFIGQSFLGSNVNLFVIFKTNGISQQEKLGTCGSPSSRAGVIIILPHYHWVHRRVGSGCPPKVLFSLMRVASTGAKMARKMRGHLKGAAVSLPLDLSCWCWNSVRVVPLNFIHWHPSWKGPERTSKRHLRCLNGKTESHTRAVFHPWSQLVTE